MLVPHRVSEFRLASFRVLRLPSGGRASEAREGRGHLPYLSRATVRISDYDGSSQRVGQGSPALCAASATSRLAGTDRSA